MLSLHPLLHRTYFQGLIRRTQTDLLFADVHDMQLFAPPRIRPHFESTASAPSLRATEHDYLRTFGSPGAAAAPQPDQDSANVKVVVRVRQFVQRGEFAFLQCLMAAYGVQRDRSQCAMFGADGPRIANHDAARPIRRRQGPPREQVLHL
jgi:hypothetical protein